MINNKLFEEIPKMPVIQLWYNDWKSLLIISIACYYIEKIIYCVQEYLVIIFENQSSVKLATADAEKIIM
jgi:hypothetical protein